VTGDSLTVIVPTYRRVKPLAECLNGLQVQTRPADQVVVVVHVSDHETRDYIREGAGYWPELMLALVRRAGVVAAQNQGLALATGSIVAFCDDDAIPHPDWAQRLMATFARDERIAAVGGRDVIHVDRGILGADSPGGWRRVLGPPPVGRIQWWGRMTGNHHRADAQACDTDVLKGVNMAFRRSQVIGLGFDERLQGKGAIVHHELSVCLPLRKRRMRVVYDPAILVDHHPAARAAGDHRTDDRPGVITDLSYNEALSILDYFARSRRLVFMIWAFMVGTSGAPGLAVVLRDLTAGRPRAWSRFAAAQRGRLRAWQTHRTDRRKVRGSQRAGST
jgi:cellulose synthase/poly-beta-1,6-N-acetylglucosamine synthase-like glycosyltransferase